MSDGHVDKYSRLHLRKKGYNESKPREKKMRTLIGLDAGNEEK